MLLSLSVMYGAAVYIQTLYEDMFKDFDTGNYEHSCIYLELVDSEWVINVNEREALRSFLPKSITLAVTPRTRI